MTTQGSDLQFGTNVLGHSYLTKHLLPTLLATSKISSDGKARVMHTSSFTSRFAGSINFNTLKDGSPRIAMGTHDLYNQNKLGNVVVSNEFARRYGDQGLMSVALNPGNPKSDLQRHMSTVRETIARTMFLHPVNLGALTQLWAGTLKEGASMNGMYLIPWARYGEAPPPALDEKLGQDLWSWLEEQVESI